MTKFKKSILMEIIKELYHFLQYENVIYENKIKMKIK